ncbi:MAG: HAD family hydrolase [Micromonosporaceae bacterium]
MNPRPRGAHPPAGPEGSGGQGEQASALQAVMFDMDGLLVDTEPFWFEVESEVMARLGGTWTPDDQAQLVGGSLSRSIRYLLAKADAQRQNAEGAGRGSGPSGSGVSLEGAVPPRAGTDAETVGRWMVEGMVSRIEAGGVRLLPGAAELLAAVAAEGIPCALVTSSERTIMDAVLSRLNTGAGGVTFQTTVCGADVSRSKPHPEPYLLAAARLGAQPPRCVVLEDAPNGVASAEAAGCLVIAVPGLVQLAPRNGRVVVPSLREVSVPLLRDLAASRGLSAH